MNIFTRWINKRHKEKPVRDTAEAPVPTDDPSITDPDIDVVVNIRTDVGCRRETNEDCGRYVKPGAVQVLESKGVLACVADGMGGHAAGEEASRIATDVLTRDYYEHGGDPQEALTAAMESANRAIYEAARDNPDLAGMGTTCTALVVIRDRAYYAHVGDSRLYRFRGGSLELLSEDHTLVQQMVRQGTINAEEAERHEDKNVILRALGTQPEVEVAYWDEPLALQVGDRFLLCSDGLYDLVTNKEIAQLGALTPVSLATESLIALAKDRGGYDNITVGVLQIQNAQPPKTVRGTREVEVLSW